MSITNSDVRAHLRKGELAVRILEDLGYTYGDGRWVAPVDVFQPIKAAMLKLAAEMTANQQAAHPPCDATELKAGERFKILSLPAGHVLLGKPDMRSRHFKACAVENGNGAYTGRVVRFGLTHRDTDFWLPLTCVAKVDSNADF